MKYVKTFAGMIQFFTRIPLRIQTSFEKEAFGKGLVFAPMVGAVIGLFLMGLYFLSVRFFPSLIVSAILLIGYILITGGLHLDGLGDTCDGIFSNRDRDRMLEIMRDSRVGTNAVLGILSVLLCNYAILASLKPEMVPTALLLMPIAGRIGSLVGAGLHSYARNDAGLGRAFIEQCGKKEILWGFLTGMIVFYLADEVKGLLLALIALISSIWISGYFSKKINGVTGDILGAVCELNQTVFLVAFFLSHPMVLP